MNQRGTNRKRRAEAGIALLISIFVLLLISVIAIALVVSSGTESALAGNYRSSTGVYYAALSGLEEARGRLLSKNPDAFRTTDASTFLPPPGTALNMGDTYYLINPVGGEVITPWDSSSTYPDNQFGVEFGPSGFTAPTNPSPKAFSVWNRNPLQALNLPGPLYKWVRINAVSEKSLGVDADSDNLANSTTPLYYNGSSFSNSPSAGPQVLELTSFAVLPNGSQKIVQYLAAPVPITLPPLQAGLTLAGSVTSLGATVGFSAPGTNAGFSIKGDDQDCNSPANLTGAHFRAIGVLNSTDIFSVQNSSNVNGVHFTGIPSTYWPSYTGLTTSTPPDIGTVNSFFSGSMTTPSGLNSVVQTIIQNADATVPTTSGSAERTFLTGLLSSGAMSSTSPLTVVVNGDLDLTGWNHTGYGLLLVTGTLTYDPDASWDGIVMVVGKGMVVGSKSGSGEFDGAMFVAQTLDPSTGYTTVLPGSSLGNAFVDFNHDWSSTPFPPPAPPAPPQMSMGGKGIRYSNCWIQKAQPTSGFKILSFHEIAQ